ncbi:hypothetical protein LJR074_004475 [Acidovorax sp. LjRoot74]|uniref:hypothetical protein n=1 Tax=Acidovorax sp. LjRoot74 TaxID=3342337 RepID=UPI003ECD361B
MYRLKRVEKGKQAVLGLWRASRAPGAKPLRALRSVLKTLKWWALAADLTSEAAQCLDGKKCANAQRKKPR